MPEPSIEVIGNKASEQGAHEQGADFEQINRSDAVLMPEPIRVKLKPGVNEITIIPEKQFFGLAELKEGPTSIVQAQITEDPESYPDEEELLIETFKVACESIERLNEIRKRSPRESLIWFHVEGLKMDMAVTGKRVIVLQDVTESVYSCRTCHGKGHLEKTCSICGGKGQDCSTCICVSFGHETPYSCGMKTCPDCSVTNKGVRWSNGWARGIIIPDTSMSLPVTGIVLSIGPECRLLKLGDRVQFSRYAGHHTTMRGGRTFITMAETEILCLMREADYGNVEAGKAS